MKLKSPIILLILDGWGLAPPWGANAIAQAKTVNYDKLWREYPHSQLEASGKYVGLPGHERGNSEVGHLNIGSGRVVEQDSSRIMDSIEDGSFFQNEKLIGAIDHAKKNNSNLHIMGILSTGIVHGDIKHLFALLELAKKQNFNRVYIHIFTDGRDTPTMAGIELIEALLTKINDIGIGKIVSIIGRSFAMDRNNHWNRTQKCYNLLVKGEGEKFSSPVKAIAHAYKAGQTDEYTKAIGIIDQNSQSVTVNDNDSLIFLNFRADRARQITQAFMSKNFKEFNRKKVNNIYFVSMIVYGAERELGKNIHSAFKPQKLNNVLAEVLSKNSLTQFHIAETEKYAHITYFFNGGHEKPFSGEERLIIPSPNVETYDQKPEMSVDQIVYEVIKRLNQNKYDFIVINFANTDMVGHTGDYKAAVNAVEKVDENIGKLCEVIKKYDGILIITADHGNSDEMIYPRTGEMSTQHSRNPVPFILINGDKKHKLKPAGVLSDIAPTILNLINISKPAEMTGKSLIVSDDANLRMNANDANDNLKLKINNS